jgi:uncharacterized membrane protein YdbT with pleckstrin-like domain
MPKHFTFFNTTNYTFEGKKEGEEVILYLHRHWWTLANRILALVTAAFLPFVAVVAFGQILIAENLMSIFAFLWAGYYLMLWFFFFYSLTIYNLNSWIVTNMRIIDQHQRGFFNQEVAELSLVNIQDVSFKMEGMVATMMNYGRIEVQTAGNDQKFIFSDIPNPQTVKDEIMKIAADQKGHNGVFNPVENPIVPPPAPVINS